MSSDRNKYSSKKFTPAERERQKVQALRLWMAGAQYKEIGEALGVATMTAYTRVQKALDDMRPHADFDRYRSIQLAEIEMMRRPMRQVIVRFGQEENPSTLNQCTKAISSLIRIQEREANLLGLDKLPSAFDEFSNMSDEDLAAEVSRMADEMSAEA